MNKKIKRLCFIFDSKPNKKDGASLRVYYEYIRFFVNDNFDITIIYFAEKNEKKFKFSHKKNVNIIFLEKKNHLLPNKFKLINNLNEQETIESILIKFRIQMVVAFDIVAISQLSSSILIPKIGWLGDLRFLTNKFNFYFSVKENFKNITSFFYNFVQNILIRNFYKINLNKLDKIIVSSFSSVNELKKLNFKSEFLPYPWPEKFSKTVLKIKIPTFLFFGNLSGLGSRSSIIEIINNIYPKMLMKFGNKKFKILVGGINFKNSYLNRIDLDQFPEINFIGYIKNLEKIAPECNAFIFPGKVPIGNRCRLLTCLASEILLIVSESVTLGNNYLKNKYNSLVAKNTNEFIEHMFFSFYNPEACKVITENAKQTYNNNYRPKEAIKKLKEIVLKV